MVERTATSWRRRCWVSSSDDRRGWCRAPRGRDAVAEQRPPRCGSRPSPADRRSAPSWCRPASRRREAATGLPAAAWTCTAGHQLAEASVDTGTPRRAYYNDHKQVSAVTAGQILKLALGLWLVGLGLASESIAQASVAQTVCLSNVWRLRRPELFHTFETKYKNC